MATTEQDALKKRVKLEIQSLLCTEKEAITSSRLYGSYRGEMNENIPYMKLGFRSLDELLMSMPDVVHWFIMDGQLYVRAVPQAGSSHINELVHGQRKQKKKPTTKPSLMQFGSRPRYTAPFQTNNWNDKNRIRPFNSTRPSYSLNAGKPNYSFRPAYKPHPVVNKTSNFLLNMNFQPMLPRPAAVVKSRTPSPRSTPVPLQMNNEVAELDQCMSSMAIGKSSTPTPYASPVSNQESFQDIPETVIEKSQAAETIPETQANSDLPKSTETALLMDRRAHESMPPLEISILPGTAGSALFREAIAKLPKVTKTIQVPAAETRKVYLRQSPSSGRNSNLSITTSNGHRPNSPPSPSLFMAQPPPLVKQLVPRRHYDEDDFIRPARPELHLERLKRLAETRHLGRLSLQHAKTKNGRFVAAIYIGQMAFKTFPEEFDEMGDAYEAAAQSAVLHFLPPSGPPSLPAWMVGSNNY